MRRNKGGYFGLVVTTVVAAALLGVYALTRSTGRHMAPAPPAPAATTSPAPARTQAPAAPVEILQVLRAPEVDNVAHGVGGLVAFKVKNVSDRTVTAAVITVVLLDPDKDEIRRFSFGLGGATGYTQRGCEAPLRPGDYCFHKEIVQGEDYRRMAGFAATVRLGR